MKNQKSQFSILVLFVSITTLFLFSACSGTSFSGSANNSNQRKNVSKPQPIVTPEPTENNTPIITPTPSPNPIIPSNVVNPSDIPGAEYEKVGLEFEDWTDFDYDVRLCLEGYFKVDGNNIVSFKDQTITATSKAKGECDHRIDVKITNPDGTANNQSYPSKATKDVPMVLKVGSRMEVTLTPIKGNLCTEAGTLNVPITITDERGKINPGECR